MYARVVTAQIQPGKIDEATQTMESDVAPGVKRERGFKSFLFMVDRTSGKAMAVSVYESEADIAASAAGFRQRAGTMARVLTAPPTAEVFEVTNHG